MKGQVISCALFVLCRGQAAHPGPSFFLICNHVRALWREVGRAYDHDHEISVCVINV